MLIPLAMMIVVTIVAISIYYYYRQAYVLTFWSDVPIQNGKYGTYLPSNALDDEIRYRSDPTSVERKYGGKAVWSKHELYHSIVVSDAATPISTPVKMIRSVFYTLRLNIDPDSFPSKQLKPLESLIIWDPTTKLVQVASYFMGGCQYLLWLIVRLIGESIEQRNSKSVDESATDIVDKYCAAIDQLRPNPGLGFTYEAELMSSPLVLPNNKVKVFN